MESYEPDQYMKPHGDEGILVIEEMNDEHRYIGDFALECVDVDENAKVIDLGCGGGVNIERFLELTKNNVDGLDYSDVAVAQSIKRNQKAVDEKRCNVICSDVTDMPIEEDSYDLATAFSTIFFWPDLAETFREVLRIIKPGGKFMIAQGTDGTNPMDEEWIDTIKGINVYTADELESYLLEAGFKSVEIFKKEATYLLVVIGKK